MVPEEFRKRLFDWPDAPVPVAFDGALFDDLPSLLKNASFKPRSLFLEQTDREIQRTSPQFIMAPHDRLELLLSLPDITTGGVFWNAPGVEEMAFYRHLRSLTMVRLPVPEKEQKPGDPKTEMCVFRHFDPATVAITMPVMTPAQRARVMGPAKSFLLHSPEGAMEAKRRVEWPDAEKGTLTFNSVQMKIITKNLNKRRHYRPVLRFLRDCGPISIQNETDVWLLELIDAAESRRVEWGLKTQSGLSCLSLLSYITHGKIYTNSQLKNKISENTKYSDKKIKKYTIELINLLETNGDY
ncbi:hypothetical protein J2D73_19945 [Acetobacter sacchari]|uniref:DUF4123 domain-containing protein n=1 Tax=Acetobacter sacchari TaxID=2661687 RepID=A0ABS3M1I1_9PROT|nr:DUF4123 domain-containing protein [Acetobacter sacchari]MBO1362057.1 hypothetical protein [Acetobacter sacchari]